MKKIYAIIAIMFLFAGAFAQTSNNIQNHGEGLKPMTKVFPPSTIHNQSNQLERIQSLPNFWIDYVYADSSNQANFTGLPSVKYYGYLANSNFTLADTHTLRTHAYYNYFMVMFDTLVDSYNSAGPTPYDHRSYENFTLDTILAPFGQMNNSGLDDTLLVQVLGVDTNKTWGTHCYPNSTVLWSNTSIIPAASPLSTGNDWNNIGFFQWIPNLVIHTGRFAVKFTYSGAKTDTFTFCTSYPYHNGTNGCTGWTHVPDSTSYNPNSIVYYADRGVHGIYPDNTGASFYYDCDGSNSYTQGDGLPETHNVEIYAKVDLNATGIQENKSLGLKLFQNVPNPFNNTSVISYELAKGGAVTMNITDIAGRNIMTFNEGIMGAGKHNITVDSKDLAQGIYFYNLNVDGITLTNKMIVTKK